MSEDRMDRAERIRNMREGSRGTDEEPADDDGNADEAEPETSSVDDETTTDVAESTPQETVSDAVTDSGPGPESESESESEATETVSSGGSPTTSDVSGSATGASDVSGSAEPTPPASETPTDDATTAAQRAAAAAADISSGDADTGGGPELAQGPTGVELPDQELLEQAMSQSSVQSTEGGARAAAIEEETTQSEELVRVLEFALGEEYYCLDIEYVEEIVKRDAVTRVPNTADFVDGVVDLRGQITTILEPKEMMDIETEGAQDLIIVFDPDKFEDQGAVGWVVDEVRQVVPITESEVNEPPVDAEYINGVVDHEEYDQFVIWIEPDDALAQATGGDEG